MPIRLRTFEAGETPWEALFRQAGAFATGVGQGRLIDISHTATQGHASIAVWYWEEDREAGAPAALPGGSRGQPLAVRFEMFHALGKPWTDLFQEAADFAEGIGRDHLIAIAHSEDQDDSVVCVWYWEHAPASQEAGLSPTPAPTPPTGAAPNSRTGRRRKQ